MTIIQNQNTKANPDEKLAVQLSGEIQKQLGICFKKTDGTLRGTCPACEEDATLRIELITDDRVGYACSTCGISGFDADDLAREMDAFDPGCGFWKSADLSEVDAVQVQALRELAAQHFHDNLVTHGSEGVYDLGDDKFSVIDYLVDRRGHSIDTLKRFRVGVSNEGIYDLAHDNQFTDADLIAAGLLRSSNHHYWNEGLLLFPHIKDGNVSHFSQKDPRGEYSHQSMKQHRNAECLWYNLDAATDAEVLICVEGEHDVLSVAGKAAPSNAKPTLAILRRTQTQQVARLHQIDWQRVRTLGDTHQD